jgi:hypothetical protein
MPADRFKALASRALGLWRVVRLFREVGSRGIPETRDIVRHKTIRILDALDPATRAISEINQQGFSEKILGDTVEAAAVAAKSAIDKTAIVLAHSILDDVVSECCELSALLMPDSSVRSQRRIARVSELLAFSQKKQEDVLPGNVMVTKTVTVVQKQQICPSPSGHQLL